MKKKKPNKIGTSKRGHGADITAIQGSRDGDMGPGWGGGDRER